MNYPKIYSFKAPPPPPATKKGTQGKGLCQQLHLPTRTPSLKSVCLLMPKLASDQGQATCIPGGLNRQVDKGAAKFLAPLSQHEKSSEHLSSHTLLL